MKSPFPGMDPFIEARGLWSDFHHKFITGIHDAIADQLPPQFVARIDERNYIDTVDPVEEVKQRRVFVPDIVIEQHERAEAEEARVAVLAPEVGSIVMHPLLELEQREIYLEVWELDPDRRLVTCIEVLSPANKRYASTGWNEYQHKRQLFFQGHANFVEIDLLRRGRRLQVVEEWPDCPYYIMVMRKEKAPAASVWPANALEPMPKIPIPLSPAYADVVLELQPLVDAIYRRSRYSVDLQYHLPTKMQLRADELQRLLEDKNQRKTK
jgi:hypothetical protein